VICNRETVNTRGDGTAIHNGKRVKILPNIDSVSVIIPVYRGSVTLDETLEILTSDPFAHKEVIVSIDMPDTDSLRLVEKFSNRVIFDLSYERRGKVEALRSAISRATGEAFFFLDSDIRLTTRGIIGKVAEELKEYEMIELKKTVNTSNAISKLVYFEYIGIGAADWLVSRKTKRTFGINGAAFAITREAFDRVGGFKKVVSEDLDFGLRSFIADVSFKYCVDLEVMTFSPPSLRSWFVQRKRWAYGTSLWVKENWNTLLSLVRHEPSVTLPALMMIFPALMGLMTSFAFRGFLVYDILAILILSLPTRGLPVLLFPLVTIQEATNLLGFSLAFGVGLAAYGLVYFYYSRKLGFRFSPIWFVPYYLVYSPVWLAAMIWGMSQVFIKKEPVSLDWKT
jgi:cellulose synthase/poly-beta-1,6-N-acetylglucosamine synthase-like glycosyltransferase